MTPRTYIQWLSVLMAALLTGCMATTSETVKPTYAVYAQRQIPEEQLLDVGIQVFDAREPEEGQEEHAEAEGYHPDVKKAESHFIPYHLKHTLQNTGHWGAVRVTPVKADSVDVTVKGTIVESNGLDMVIDVRVEDTSGATWFVKRYKAQAGQAAYDNTRKGKEDPYQDFYNALSNDMLAYKKTLSPAEISTLRQVSRLKFASDVAPDAFANYLERNGDGRYSIKHLPADNDPMMQRVMRIREREYMFIDTINEYYSQFYDDMWDPYVSWRASYLDEAEARRKLQRKATQRKLLGIGAILGAVAIEVAGGNSNTGTLRDLMVVGGAYSFKTGMDASSDARIHADALRELGTSFGADIQPVVMEVEGKTVELNGTAEEQYEEWRRLLRDIFAAETGFIPETPATETTPN